MSVDYNYGRLPDDLRSVFARLSHLEMHVYSMLMITSIRSENNGNVGCVNISKSALAREMGVDPKSIRVAAKGLFAAGLLKDGTKLCPKSWALIPHYLGDSPLPSEGSSPTPLRAHPLPPRVSSPTKSPQPQQKTDTYEPLKRSEDVSEDVVDDVSAGNGHKKTRKSSSWLIWDSSEEKLVSRPGETFQKRRDEFMALWFERLGNEEAFYEQLSQADKWLKANPNKRGKTKRFDTFFSRWLDRCLEG